MKKTSIVCIALAFVLLLGFSCFAAAPDSSYLLTLSEEFVGTKLNTDMWHYRLNDTYGGKNLAENVRVADGKLYLDYTKTNGYYSGAGIITNDFLPYGYYETKAKFFNGVKGLHTSFWTSGGALEIDGFESDTSTSTGSPTPYYCLHYWWGEHENLGSRSYSVDTDGNNKTSDWFTMGFEWLPGKVNYYANGKLVGTLYPDVYTPSTLWLTAVATPAWSNYNIDDSKLDANGRFGSSEYEYFRYYAKKLKGVNLLGNGHFELVRESSLTTARYFGIKKGVVSSKSAYAHSGYVYAFMSQDSELGEEFKYLAPAKYTFEGYFKAPAGTNATLSVKDAEGNVIKSVAIPQCNDWTLVSLKDVAVEYYASPIVEVSAGTLCVDDLTFHCQEGDTTYENYAEGDYKKYNALPSSDTAAINHSLIANVGLDTFQFSNNPFSFGGKVPYKQNGETYIPYQAIKDKISISGVSGSAEYVSLTQINTSSDYRGIVNGSCIIIHPSSYSVASTIFIEAQSSLNSLIDPTSYNYKDTVYCGTTDRTGQIVYTFDSAITNGAWGSSSLGYMADGKYCGDLSASVIWPVRIATGSKYSVQIYSNSHSGSNGASPTTSSARVVLTTKGTAYSYTLNQYNGATGWYDLGTFDFEPGENFTLKLYNAAGEGLLRASAIRIIPENYRTATFLGTNDVEDQQILGINDCTLSGSWSSSGLGYGGSSKYSSNITNSALWTYVAEEDGKYAVHFYNIAHAGDKASGATPSTKMAGLVAKHGTTNSIYYFDQCDGESGWYDIGEFNLKKGESISVELYNMAEGHLRANALRMIFTPGKQNRDAVYVGTANVDGQKVLTVTDCSFVGSWSTSSLGYNSSSKYSGADNISATWNVVPDTTRKYSIQIYSVVHAGNPAGNVSPSTSAAGVDVTVGKNSYTYLLNQSSGQAGWYDLGEFDLTAGQIVPVVLYRTVSDGHLRASAVRFIPLSEEVPPAEHFYVGAANETNQELYGFDTAVKTGKWLQSGGTLWDCYYGDGVNATATWNITPAHNKKYSVQIYIPCILNGNTTKDAVVNLTVGKEQFEHHFDQQLDTSSNSGWYDLGLFDLTTSTQVTAKISMTSGQFLRAKAVRLVPVPETIQVTKSGTSVTAKLGFLGNHIENVIFAEYSGEKLELVTISDSASSVDYTMSNQNNSLKVFVWNSIYTMQPLTTVTTK